MGHEKHSAIDYVFCSFYVILSGNTSVYIDPKMTGEDDGGTMIIKKQEPAPKKKTESETENTDEKKDGEDEDDEAEKAESIIEEKKLAPLDRTKFGKYIMTYGESKLKNMQRLVKCLNFNIILKRNVAIHLFYWV